MYKRQSHPCTPTMNKWDVKFKKKYHLHHHLKNEIGANLTKYVQNLDEENYETLMNKIKEDLNNPCHG